MILISSCLTGIKCRYNATDSYHQSLLEHVGDNYLTVCPEILAGFGIPRIPCEIVGGSGADVLNGTARIMDKNGKDITKQILDGAQKALEICLKNNITIAYLPPRSPTCGYGTIYDGSFSSRLITGNGIFAELLMQHGIEVVAICEKTFDV